MKSFINIIKHSKHLKRELIIDEKRPVMQFSLSRDAVWNVNERIAY